MHGWELALSCPFPFAAKKRMGTLSMRVCDGSGREYEAEMRHSKASGSHSTECTLLEGVGVTTTGWKMLARSSACRDNHMDANVNINSMT
jgi:hypothetical protein